MAGWQWLAYKGGVHGDYGEDRSWGNDRGARREWCMCMGQECDVCMCVCDVCVCVWQGVAKAFKKAKVQETMDIDGFFR